MREARQGSHSDSRRKRKKELFISVGVIAVLLCVAVVAVCGAGGGDSGGSSDIGTAGTEQLAGSGSEGSDPEESGGSASGDSGTAASVASADEDTEAEKGEDEEEDEESEDFDELTYLTLYGKDYTYSHRIETYLALGTDHSGDEEAESGSYQGSMADFLVLLILDRTDKSYASLHLNRDTVTEIQMLFDDDTVAETRDMQLCTAHWYGSSRESGCENTVEAVSAMLGELPIDGYYALPMDGISSLNHTVGGVTVTIEDDFSDADPSLVMGETITLSDEQAYHYVHDRMNVGEGDNLSRMRRQRQYLHNFSEKARALMAENPSLAADIYREFQGIATTDLAANKATKIASLLAQYEDRGSYEFEGTLTEGDVLGDGMDHALFYLDESSVVSVLAEIYGLREEE